MYPLCGSIPLDIVRVASKIDRVTPMGLYFEIISSVSLTLKVVCESSTKTFSQKMQEHLLLAPLRPYKMANILKSQHNN